MSTPPPDLSICQDCGQRVPPSNHPDFAKWVVTKDERGRPRGMLCPACQAKAGAGEASSSSSG